jgi:hypothetical protein
VPAGMRGVVLSFGSEQQALMSIDFLRKANPLEHNAPVKKSQVCELGRHSRGESPSSGLECRELLCRAGVAFAHVAIAPQWVLLLCLLHNSNVNDHACHASACCRCLHPEQLAPAHAPLVSSWPAPPRAV